MNLELEVRTAHNNRLVKSLTIDNVQVLSLITEVFETTNPRHMTFTRLNVGTEPMFRFRSSRVIDIDGVELGGIGPAPQGLIYEVQATGADAVIFAKIILHTICSHLHLNRGMGSVEVVTVLPAIAAAIDALEIPDMVDLAELQSRPA